MFKNLFFALALVASVAAGDATAQRPSRGMMNDHYYEKIASDWVQLYLRRNPTPREVALVTNQLRSGMNANAVQANILASDEYYIRVNRNLNTWSQSVVADILGRRITPYELSILQQAAVQNGRNAAAFLVLDSRASWSSPPWWWGW